MNKYFSIFLVILLGCNEKGIPTSYPDSCKLENTDKTLEIQGYLSDGGSLYCSSTSGRYECGFEFRNSPGDAEKYSADIAVGTSRNAVEELKSGYAPSDIKIYDDTKALISLSDKVKITGKIRAFKDETSPEPEKVHCYIKVYKIEKVTP